MRSPSEPEPSTSKEHVLLEAVEASYVIADERQARCKLLEESEKNIREGAFPELYPRRCRNMQLLFDLLRQSRVPLDTDFWLEARLLRLMDRHEQCRQLCQTRPPYDWTFDVLQEFVWASRGDAFPYPRRSSFADEQDAAVANQLFTAAKTLYGAKCYEWQQAHDAVAKPTPREQRVSLVSGIGLFVVIAASIVVWNLYNGWVAFLVFVIGGTLVMNLLGDDREMVKQRMRAWETDNPKPKAMTLTLHHLPLPRVYISPDFS
jgi:hypothetical protein